MKMFFNWPPGIPLSHPVISKVRRMFLPKGFQETDSPFDASHVVNFLGSQTTGVGSDREIYVYDFDYAHPATPKFSLLVDLKREAVPKFNRKGYCVDRIPLRQYLLEWLRDPMADSLL